MNRRVTSGIMLLLLPLHLLGGCTAYRAQASSELRPGQRLDVQFRTPTPVHVEGDRGEGWTIPNVERIRGSFGSSTADSLYLARIFPVESPGQTAPEIFGGGAFRHDINATYRVPRFDPLRTGLLVAAIVAIPVGFLAYAVSNLSYGGDGSW